MIKINDVEFPIVKFLPIIQGRMSGWSHGLFVPSFSQVYNEGVGWNSFIILAA